MSVHTEFVSGNQKYASTFDKGQLVLPPAKHLIVVTCMDARVEPLSQLGINLGDAHIIRNAGGLARESIRSIVISQRLLGTREIAIFRHVGCGMLLFTSDQVRDIVKSAEPESVKTDVQFLKENPLVLKDTTITGWIYDVETGKAKQIV